MTSLHAYTYIYIYIYAHTCIYAYTYIYVCRFYDKPCPTKHPTIWGLKEAIVALRYIFSKVSSIVILHSKLSGKLTFENIEWQADFCEHLPAALSWKFSKVSSIVI